jgi:Lyzozyme M1 (1,4-beta-N-acetylmuramidase)
MVLGIDVSRHNGVIDWKKVKSDNVEFAMIRGGFGSDEKQKDARFDYNAAEARKNGIDTGMYWFSYALSPADAVKEAKLCLDIAKPHEMTYPIAFDFEYDSVRYAAERGVTVTQKLACDIARAFLSTVEDAGYYAMNYTNPDYINKYFGSIAGEYDLWCASWGSKKPQMKLGIWQYEVRGSESDVKARPQRATVVGKVNGIVGAVDMNYAYVDYPKLIRANGLNNLTPMKVDYADLVCKKCGLEEQTKVFLSEYKYASDLWRKLWEAMS